MTRFEASKTKKLSEKVRKKRSTQKSKAVLNPLEGIGIEDRSSQDQVETNSPVFNMPSQDSNDFADQLKLTLFGGTMDQPSLNHSAVEAINNVDQAIIEDALKNLTESDLLNFEVLFDPAESPDDTSQSRPKHDI